MKGIILAGGNGTRLLPLTKSVNKSLLPIGNKPMLQHCVEKFTESGIDNIMVITGGNHLGGVAEFLGSGKDFGCNVTYKVQDEAGGIAQALSLAERFVDDDQMCVLLGDNIFQSSLTDLFVQYYMQTNIGAMVVLKGVLDPERFGVATIDGGHITKIVEKPKTPESNYAVTGIYMYTSSVFDIIRKCKPSGRGELEITDVNNAYILQNSLRYVIMNGWWTDAGTHESYQKANELYKEMKNGN
jgi:glucose-1-phosphate thymidylyltransferase